MPSSWFKTGSRSPTPTTFDYMPWRRWVLKKKRMRIKVLCWTIKKTTTKRKIRRQKKNIRKTKQNKIDKSTFSNWNFIRFHRSFWHWHDSVLIVFIFFFFEKLELKIPIAMCLPTLFECNSSLLLPLVELKRVQCDYSFFFLFFSLARKKDIVWFEDFYPILFAMEAS